MEILKAKVEKKQYFVVLVNSKGGSGPSGNGLRKKSIYCSWNYVKIHYSKVEVEKY